jgi:hypothetical protein
MKIPVTIDIDMLKLWEAVWGSDGAGSTYWCSEIRDIDGESIHLWTPEWKPNPQDFCVYDHEAEEWHDVSLKQLANGYAKALNESAGHCGTRLDIEDPDACVGDIILQYAVFGELTYG